MSPSLTQCSGWAFARGPTRGMHFRFLVTGTLILGATPATVVHAQLGAGPGYTYAVTHRDSAGGVEAYGETIGYLAFKIAKPRGG
jgi:hypothetical protein